MGNSSKPIASFGGKLLAKFMTANKFFPSKSKFYVINRHDASDPDSDDAAGSVSSEKDESGPSKIPRLEPTQQKAS